ncbi:MAG: GDP-mannose 4,6-dehydratase [Anaerolineaceae bacterium]|nr:GDP-mannose 4,6-dehydratase [Anaerolineaceae bacterium]MCB9102158.1 GDP-mannose 4,6-dehydratase [Anaerolineales bacterium]
MRALITGITGFAGSHLAQILLDRGDKVVGVARSRTKTLDYLSQPIEPITADLRDPNAVNQLISDVQPEAIYHLAGQAFVPRSWANPWDTMESNIRPQLNILEAMLSCGCQARLLISTSNEVYGRISEDQLPVREDTPLHPQNPYGVSKVTQDLMALQYHLSRNVDVLRARAFNHIGPRQNPFFVAASFAKQIAQIEVGRNEPVIYVGNLEAQRDFTDVIDVTRAYALLIEHGESGEAYNIGTGRAYSIQYLLDVLLKYSNIRIEIKPDPERMRPSDIPVIYADNSKLCSQTGWQPLYKFEDSLQRVLDYWRKEVKQTI